jgi:hypothetical protein
MRTYLIIILFIVTVQSIHCQDKITTKGRYELNVKVIEQTDKLVKYKMSDYENGPILTMKRRSISSIEYKNGVIDQMGNQNPRNYKRFGINTGLVYGLNDATFTATFDYFIIPQIDIEINFGSDFYRDLSYFSSGARFHANHDISDKKFTPFTGLLFGSSYEEDFIQIPVGISYITRAGISTSLSLNGTINRKTHIYKYIPPQRMIVEFRIGWRFKA